ncbi:hypothetical protein CQW23_34607 [Capsicum baccatum]|uniref:Protein TAR1 n=1 Tax=Capsicum baccatum TaxID=33114 RepID=A0A2G2UYI7_CAPBA|nr:hypothetical protein CQW23_34607 [Capsicum baccatum]
MPPRTDVVLHASLSTYAALRIAENLRLRCRCFSQEATERPLDIGKTNLSHDGLNPAHVPYWWVNNPTLGEFCFTMIGRADIEGSKSNVAMNAWLPQASYPCGNFSDTSSFEFRRSKGSLGHAFTMCRPSQTPHLTMSSARIGPQSEPWIQKEGQCPVSDSRNNRIPLVRTSSELDVRRAGKAPEGTVPSPSPGRHAATRSHRGISSRSPPTADGFMTGTPVPSPQSQSFSRSYGSILPTSLAYIVPSTRGCSPWRPDAVMSTTGRGRHSVLRIFKGRRERTGHHATCGALPAAGPYLRLSRFQGQRPELADGFKVSTTVVFKESRTGQIGADEGPMPAVSAASENPDCRSRTTISHDEARDSWDASTGNRLRASLHCACPMTEMADGSGRRCSSRDPT